MSSFTTYTTLETAALEALAQLRGLPADGGMAKVIERLEAQDHEDAAAAAEIAGNCKDEPAGGHSWEVVGSKKKKKAQQTTTEPVVPQYTAFSWADEAEEDIAALMAQDDTPAIPMNTEGTPAPTPVVDDVVVQLSKSVPTANINESVDLQTKEPAVPRYTAFSWAVEVEEDLAASMLQDNTLAICTDTEGTPASTSIVDDAATELASFVLHTNTNEPVVPQYTAFSWADEVEEDLAASMAQDNTPAIFMDTEGTPASTTIVDDAAAELASSVLHTVLHNDINEPVHLQVDMDCSEEGDDDVEDLQAPTSSEDAEEENGEDLEEASAEESADDVEVIHAAPSSEETEEEEENGEDLTEASAEDNMTRGGPSSATSMSGEEDLKSGCDASWKAMKMRRARKMEGVFFEPLYISSDDEDEVEDTMPNDEANTDSSPTEAPSADKKKSRKRGKKGGRKAQKQAQKQANKLVGKTAVEQGESSVHKLNIVMAAMAIGALSFALGVVATRRV
jgi:hypothetical protein